MGLGFNTAANRVAKSTHATIYALDARTGKELWSSGNQITSFNHFSGLSVANGRVYIGTYDGMLYCFGVDRTPSSSDERQIETRGAAQMKPGSKRFMGAVVVAPRAARRVVQAQGRGGEWTTSHGDAQRTSWVRSDVRLTKDAVQKGELKFLWKMKLDNETRQLNSLTTPVLMDRLISHRGFKALAFVGASGERVYAIDTDLARVYWTTVINYSSITPPANSSWACPGGLMAAATRPTTVAVSAFGGGGGGRGGRSGSSVGEPGKGAPSLALVGQGRGAAPGDPAAGRGAAPALPARSPARVKAQLAVRQLRRSGTRWRRRAWWRPDRQHLRRRERRLRANDQSAQRIRPRAAGAVPAGECPAIGLDRRRRRALHDDIERLWRRAEWRLGDRSRQRCEEAR